MGCPHFSQKRTCVCASVCVCVCVCVSEWVRVWVFVSLCERMWMCVCVCVNYYSELRWRSPPTQDGHARVCSITLISVCNAARRRRACVHWRPQKTETATSNNTGARNILIMRRWWETSSKQTWANSCESRIKISRVNTWWFLLCFCSRSKEQWGAENTPQIDTRVIEQLVYYPRPGASDEHQHIRSGAAANNRGATFPKKPWANIIASTLKDWRGLCL